MRIIQINCVYKDGSTGKIVSDLHTEYLTRGIDSHVLYGRGTRYSEDKTHKCATEMASKLRNGISRVTGNLYGMGYFGTRNIIHLIETINPDVVHLHCINGFFCNVYSLLDYLKKKKIPTALTLHAEFMYTGNCGYSFECNQWIQGCHDCENTFAMIGSRNTKAPSINWQRMYESLKGFGQFVAVGVSDWISDRARQSAILGDKKIITVLNGLNESVFFYRDASDMNADSDLLHLRQGKKIALFVTPYFEDENKGGQWILKLASKLNRENCQVIVVGNKAREYAVPNITFLGHIGSQEKLAELYSLADVCLLVSKKETFSMVTAESLCCGTPVVGFEAGAPERIAISECSEFVPYGDLETLADAVITWMRKPVDKKKISQAAIQKYSSKVMAENYLKVYQELLEKA